MKIEKQTTIKAVFEFTPDKYVLCKEDKFNYYLTYKIDMSYCGKPDQCGQAVVTLSEEQFNELKENGFEVFDLTQ